MTQDNIPPWAIFNAWLLRTKHDSNTKPNPHDTFSESCRSDISNDTLFGTDTLRAVE